MVELTEHQPFDLVTLGSNSHLPRLFMLLCVQFCCCRPINSTVLNSSDGIQDSVIAYEGENSGLGSNYFIFQLNKGLTFSKILCILSVPGSQGQRDWFTVCMKVNLFVDHTRFMILGNIIPIDPKFSENGTQINDIILCWQLKIQKSK